MNKLDSPYLVDSFVKVYSESQSLLNIQNGYIAQANSKKKKRLLTVSMTRDAKTTITQMVDCNKQDVLVLQSLSWLQMDSVSFAKHLRPTDKSLFTFKDFELPSLAQVLWPVALLSCYGPMKDNLRALFTDDSDLATMDSSDIFKFGNTPSKKIPEDHRINTAGN